MAWKRYYLADGMGNKRVKFNCLSAYYHAINTIYPKGIYMSQNVCAIIYLVTVVLKLLEYLVFQHWNRLDIEVEI